MIRDRRRVRYSVAMSLDGFIADPEGGYDWIVMDPEIDFSALLEGFDTVLIGRKSYESTAAGGHPGPVFGKRTLLFSTTARPEDHPGMTVVAGDPLTLLDAWRSEPGEDAWLFGGGVLFRSLLGLDQVDAVDAVDAVEVAVIPHLLGAGVPLLASPLLSKRLEYRGQRVYPSTGIVSLEYAIRRATP